MIVGNFKYNPGQDSYSGNITTLSFSRTNVCLKPFRKIGEREPDYRVVEETPTGVIEFGAAWKRRASENGRSFLSVVLDDPALGQALNLAMFDDRDGMATLVWTRPRPKAVDAEPQASAPRAKRSGAARAAGLD